MQRLQKAVHQLEIIPKTPAHPHRRSSVQMQALSQGIHRGELPQQPHADAHSRRAKATRVRSMQEAFHTRDAAQQAHA